MNRYAARRCAHGTEWHLHCNGCHVTEQRAEILAKKKVDAKKLLDRAYKGEPVTIEQINAALLATGDLQHVDCSLAEVAE